MSSRSCNGGNSTWPVVIKSEGITPPQEEANVATVAPQEQLGDLVIRMLMQLGEGQAVVLSRLNQLEQTVGALKTDIAQMDNKIKQIKDSNEMNTKLDELKGAQNLLAVQTTKIGVEMTRVAHRTGCIKDLAVNTAAHTLNTARKIHGAPSLLEPVKHFKNGGHKDWSIQPTPASPFMPPQMMPNFSQMNMNPFNPYGTAGNGHQMFPSSHQQGSRTPAFPSKSPEFSGNRTPVYGSRTPVYDGSRTPVRNRSDSEDFEVWRSGNQPQQSAYRSGSRDGSTTEKSGNGRFVPYDNRQNRNQSRASSTRPLGYEPVSPRFS